MAATTRTVKAALFLLALFCAALQWMGLRSQLSYQGHYRMAEAAGAGRLDPGDAAWLQSALERPVPAGRFTGPQLLRASALLHLYHVDLTAAGKGILPFEAAQDPGLMAARLGAAEQLKSALSRTPSDGDLWLRLALLARAGGAQGGPPPRYLDYLELSRKTAPHEGWILSRRPVPSP